MNEATGKYSDEQAFRIAWLVAGYIRNTLSEAEHEELDDWVTASLDNQLLFEELTDEQNLNRWMHWRDELDTGRALAELKSHLAPAPKTPRNRLHSFLPYAVAAALIIGVVVTVSRWQQQRRHGPAAITLPSDAAIGPGGNRAMLTLADGRIIVLDNAANGSLALQGGVAVIKKDSGLLQYSTNATPPANGAAYNTLATPRGGQYQVVLPDGSKVWLNAASTLRYPVAFSGDERKVSLSGEAYFEVAPLAAEGGGKKLPFRVHINDRATVEVLGTHFNIMAYSDEPAIATTLLEGKVLFSSSPGGSRGIVLQPEQQALLDKNNTIQTLDNANVNDIIAWKNGMTIFNHFSIRQVMRSLARWYDVEIVYRGNIKEKSFAGGIPRTAMLSEMIHVLELSGIHCRLEGKRLIVTE
jgi:ferric-dicitrate binding protein FerR (iron transport regulator)